MEKSLFRIAAAGIAVILSFTLLWGGYTFYQHHMVKKPLMQALNNIAGVQQAELSRTDNKYLITVALGQIDDLQDVYLKLDTMAGFYLDKEEVQLLIKDHRDQQLTAIYDQLQPYIYEALAKENYIWLNEEIGRQIQEQYSDVDYRFFVDGERIYLQFIREQNNLYEIIPRVFSIGKLQ